MNEVAKDENTWCVYVHISPSNKYYVGITSQKPERRWDNGNAYLKKNKKGEFTQPPFAHAILKYSWESFNHKVLYRELTKEEAEHKEMRLIALLKSNDGRHGYNVRIGGSATKLSDKTRKKLSESQKGEKGSFYGKHHTNEVKRKLSEMNKGVNHPMYGKHLSEEHKNKISQSLKGEKNPNHKSRLTDERKNKIREHMREICKLGVIRKSVYCIELNKTWDSMSDAKKETGACHISSVVNGHRKSSGKHPVTGEPLHWEYVENMELKNKIA